MTEEKMPDQIKKIMNEAKKESEPWFKRIRNAMDNESLINFQYEDYTELSESFWSYRQLFRRC